jgi:hypothetical protein
MEAQPAAACASWSGEGGTHRVPSPEDHLMAWVSKNLQQRGISTVPTMVSIL